MEHILGVLKLQGKNSSCMSLCNNIGIPKNKFWRNTLKGTYKKLFEFQAIPLFSFNISRMYSFEASTSPFTSFLTKDYDSPNKSKNNEFDVYIVGGGITGSALLYSLAHFTDLKRLGISERRANFAEVASSAKNNSQTIHCGDIETNYTLEKARKVKRQADMLRNFITKLPLSDQDECVAKCSKMVIAVGDEVGNLQNRFNLFKTHFPNMKLICKEEIAEVEPLVGMKDKYSYRDDDICAIYIENEHCTVNFNKLSMLFIKLATSMTDKKVLVNLKTEVKSIDLVANNKFRIQTTNSDIYARYVVVSACGNSLLLAQKMGFGLNFSCLPVAGSFYFTNKNFLNGKVYTMQNPALPFAAIHGDPDFVAKGKTRLGPTALPLPMLERYNMSSIKDFLKVLNPDINLCKVYLNLLKQRELRNYMLKNFIFEIPYINKRVFVQDARKIIPSLSVDHVSYAIGYGGIRPQMIDKANLKLLLGEGKIKPTGENILFNITPSPGATTCLGNAEDDMREICAKLGANFYEDKFRNTLLQGQYPIN